MSTKRRTLSRTTTFLLVAVGLGLVAWGQGCSPSSDGYRCDATGCWECDGYGCKPVPPPTPTKCTGNSSCPQGQICTEKGCVVICQSDATCPKGTVCKSGTCLAPTDPVPTPLECTTKADCAGGACIGNKCVACGGTNGPCPCTRSADCTTGEVCSGGACTAASNTCKYSSECGAGKVCADGKCVGDCENGETCPSGTQCVKGACQPQAGGCTSNAQCAPTEKCVAGACAPSCTDSSTCGPGQFCDQGACVLDTRPTPSCTGQGQCGPDQQCVGGFCKYTCQTDLECKLIDARIGYCGQDKVCRSQSEAQPQCTLSADCPQGKICISNQCK
jgi:hypothetical protein